NPASFVEERTGVLFYLLLPRQPREAKPFTRKNSVCSNFCSQPEFKMQIALRKRLLRLVFSILLATAFAVQVKAASDKGSEPDSKDTPKPTATPNFKPESITSTGTVTVEGSPIEYQAIAGTLVVHPKGWDDAATA